jgi:uncharacterized protein (TIGR02271 family)
MDYSTTQHALVAIFSDRAAAEAAVAQLTANGFDSQQVEVNSTDDLARRAASGNTAMTGASHDASGGGISGFFQRLFGTDTDPSDREYYSSASRRGQAAVVVHADDASLDRAANILNHNGAIEVESREETARGSETGSRKTVAGETGSRKTVAGETVAGETIPVVQQELQVDKRPVQRGAVRVYSRMMQQPVTEQVELKEERVRVDRRKANRPATEADLAAADRDVIEVTETVEEPVISKRSRVVEEVVIGKDVTSRTETVRDSVLKSEVNVDDSRRGADPLDSDFRSDYQARFAADPNLRYEDFAPAYRYGHEMASDPRYASRNFDDVADDLKTDYMRHNPNSTWERMKGAVRYGWEKVTGKR